MTSLIRVDSRLNNLCFPGVPRILENTLPEHLQSETSEWQPYADYMKSTRININVRQVFPKGFEPPIEVRTT